MITAMKKDFLLPQGKYEVGRDIPEGIYLIAALNSYSCIVIEHEKDTDEYYYLADEDSKMCHIELVKGEILKVNGKVKVRHITKEVSDGFSDFCLISKIEDFLNSIKKEQSEKNEMNENAVDEKSEQDEDFDYCDNQEATSSKSRISFWQILGILFSVFSSSDESSDSGSIWSTSGKNKDTGRCDGDCANCPPHYGYRYGRWYYGHNHQHGCERGGNKGL